MKRALIVILTGCLAALVAVSQSSPKKRPKFPKLHGKHDSPVVVSDGSGRPPTKSFSASSELGWDIMPTGAQASIKKSTSTMQSGADGSYALVLDGQNARCVLQQLTTQNGQDAAIEVHLIFKWGPRDSDKDTITFEATADRDQVMLATDSTTHKFQVNRNDEKVLMYVTNDTPIPGEIVAIKDNAKTCNLTEGRAHSLTVKVYK